MAGRSPWDMFCGMQDMLAVSGGLIYALCAMDGWVFLPGAPGLKLQIVLWLPGAVFAICLAASCLIPFLRAAVRRHLLTSYRAGYGQTVISVLSGIAAPLAVAGLVVWQIHGGGRNPAPLFAAFAAGVGVLVAQAILTRGLQP